MPYPQIYQIDDPQSPEPAAPEPSRYRQRRNLANSSVQNLDRLIRKHNISEDKRAALLKLRPGMSYQQARLFYGNRDNQADAGGARDDYAGDRTDNAQASEGTFLA